MRTTGASQPWLLPLILLLLVLALRLWALDARPLWWDEGLTLTFSRLGPAANAALAVQTEDVNPPLYRWAVGAFTSLTGTTIFTTRLLSVVANLLAAAAFFKLAKLAFGRRAGVLALLLYALAPMQIYYAQEAKGYAFESAAILIGLLLWVRLHRWGLRGDGARLERPSWATWAAYALTVTLALGANYLAVLALVVENLFTLVLSFRARRAGLTWRALSGHWARWLAVQLLGGLLLLPFPLATLGGTTAGLASTSGGQTALNLYAYLGSFLGVFASGELSAGAPGVGLALLLFGAALIGYLAPQAARGRLAAHFALAWILAPLLMGYFFQQRFPWFFPRFLLFAQPALMALAGAGLAFLTLRRQGKAPSWQRRAGTLTVALLPVVLTTPLLRAHYAAPARFEEDEIWPVLLAEMRPFVRDDDLVIARLPWMPGYMDVYLPPAETPAWVLGFFDENDLDGQLAPLLRDYDRLWEIDYLVDPFNPPIDTIRWLRGRAALAYTQQSAPGTLSLLVDAESLGPDQPGPPVTGRFQNGIELRWTSGDYDTAPGEILGADLRWTTADALEPRLVRFLHLMTPDGRLAAQVDREPVMGYAPTYAWPPGQEIADPVALLLPPDLPPGDYELWVGLYDRDTLDRLPLTGGADHVVIGRVTATTPGR